ncbi:Uncharacterized protein TCAP_03679 [Tolypocladium capitatum]|uniref:Uncharacterized protein n=1 Tax=Tolypocladium capitatum TaxID=45235 RepID=A0A2K3QFS9_9HYPO|nr:Uncharacterized protein TCAP_03679 [Tolypocladium capitatum]
MFATQHYMDAMPEPGRKRLRDDDEAANSAMGFGEHRNKRLQSLPLRTSPNSRTSPKGSQQWLPSSAATPLHSSANDPNSRSHFSPWSSSPAIGSQPQDTEMDMADPPNSPSPCRVDENRATAYPGDRNAATRVLTLIHPSVAAHAEGQRSEWAGPGPTVTALNGIVNMGHQAGFSDDQFVPQEMASETDWHAVQSNRRLPSPMLEAGDSSLRQAADSVDMIVYDDAQPPESSPCMHLSPTHAMDHPNAMMDVGLRPPAQPSESDADPSSPPLGRRGHVRSKHTVNSWTWQPGMKKSFSIGYRSDCEKCRLKVPGHFNHIIIS